jgi:hypothetical protein
VLRRLIGRTGRLEGWEWKVTEVPIFRRPVPTWRYLDWRPDTGPDEYMRSWRVLGVWYERDGDGVRSLNQDLYIPCSYFTIVFSLAPAAWLVSWRRRRRAAKRARAYLCVRCGYDLRATPGRCPECGTAAVAHGASA